MEGNHEKHWKNKSLTKILGKPMFLVLEGFGFGKIFKWVTFSGGSMLVSGGGIDVDDGFWLRMMMMILVVGDFSS